jgi:hypothetical protein
LHYLWGLVGSPDEDTRAICGAGTPGLVRQDAGFGEWLVGAITLGIYSPRRLVVGCAPPRSVGATRVVDRSAR